MTGSSELHYLEMHELSLLTRTVKVSPIQVAEAQSARIEKLDGELPG